jgi:hypothetical protein
LITNQHGKIIPFTDSGHRRRARELSHRAIHYLVATSSGDPRPTTFCGITHTAEGQQIALGLDHQMRALWEYPLPHGTFRNQIEFVTSGRLLDGPAFQWLLAGPNGSIHVLDDDGQFSDQFHYGEELSGLAVAQQAGSPALLVATDQGITAWRVRRIAGPGTD